MEEKQINKVLKPGNALLIVTIVVIIATLGLIGYALYIRYDEKQNPQDLGTLIENYEDKEGVYTKLNMAYIPYGFAEEEVEGEETRYYYFAMDAEKYMYIVRLTDETYQKIEGMYSEENPTIEYELKGYAFSIPSNLKKLAVEAGNELFEEKVLTTSNLSDYVGTVYIDEVDVADNETVNNLYGVALILGIFGVVLLFILIPQRIKIMKLTKNKELMEELRNELADLTDNPYHKLKMYLTNKYVIAKSGEIIALEYKDIIWEYSQIRYVNGVAQGKTLIICDKNKRKYSVAATGANDASIDEIMIEIKDKNENVRIGYTKENREFFKNYQNVSM